MKVSLKKIFLFFDRNKNKQPFKTWIEKQEIVDKKIILNRIRRLSDGNYGDYKSISNGILELRFKQGFRIYFTEVNNNNIILLFCGGNKSSQKKDIEKAKEYKVVLDKEGLDGCIEK